MRKLVLSCVMALLGSGCVEVISHVDDFDAGPDVKPFDATGEPEASSGGPCMSGVRWNGSNNDLMNPGVPCMGSGCHTSSSKSPLTLAGTVYPPNGRRDENNCNGINGSGVAVAIMDENGVEVGGRLQVNAAGNFYTNRMLPPSYKVKVISMGREAVMEAPVTDGNCNYCHTSDPAFMMAKGRIAPKEP
jgi:hypothetical protein